MTFCFIFDCDKEHAISAYTCVAITDCSGKAAYVRETLGLNFIDNQEIVA
jgi:hypothetical protein